MNNLPYFTFFSLVFLVGTVVSTLWRVNKGLLAGKAAILFYVLSEACFTGSMPFLLFPPFSLSHWMHNAIPFVGALLFVGRIPLSVYSDKLTTLEHDRRTAQ